MTYLSALLEKHPYISGPQPQSHKVTIIKAFLDKVVNVVPLESVGYAIAHGNEHVTLQCFCVVDALFDDLPSSVLMEDGFHKAIQRVGSGMPFEIANELVRPVIGKCLSQSEYFDVKYTCNVNDRTLTIMALSSEEVSTHTYSLDMLKEKYQVVPNMDLLR